MNRRFFLATSSLGAAQLCLNSQGIASRAQEGLTPTINSGANSQESQPRESKTQDSSATSTVFQGESLDDWMTLDGGPVRIGWQAKDGEIFLKRSLIKAGHIVTKKEFGDFELAFEWKIAKGGNSGIKYRVRKYGDRTLGCEYQIYDPNGKEVQPINKTASLYDLYAPDPSVKVLEPGKWNTAKIVVKGDRIEHWLNGSIVVQATVGDSQWQKRLSESKFNDAKDFAKNKCGRIMLTDHGSDVSYRKFEFTTFETPC